MTTPLSDERLAQLNDVYDWFMTAIEVGEYEDSATDLWRIWRQKIRELLDEVERLRAENARLRKRNEWLDKHGACRLCPTSDPATYYLEGAPGSDDDDDATE